MTVQVACCVLLLLVSGALAARPTFSENRQDRLIGYEERVQGDGGAGAAERQAAGSDDLLRGTAQHRGGGDLAAKEHGAAAAGGLDGLAVDHLGSDSGAGGRTLGLEGGSDASRVVALHTQFGTIPVRLLSDVAPRTAKLVWDLAQRRGCNKCAFYRNEAKPPPGSDGPPYALLQGRMDVLEPAPRGEGAIEVKSGHVAFIPETRDFFIAYGDHPEWGTGHTVFGEVADWFATDLMISQRYTKYKHPEHGTEMRMLIREVPFKISLQSDPTYSNSIGPLKNV